VGKSCISAAAAQLEELPGRQPGQAGVEFILSDIADSIADIAKVGPIRSASAPAAARSGRPVTKNMKKT
jgi:hypothetical protein